MEGGFFALFLVFAAVAVVRSIQVMQRRNLAWQRAAQRLGITLKASTGLAGLGGKPSMEGRVKDMAVKIDIVSHNDSTFTRYRVRYPSLNLALGLKRQTFLRSLGTKLGFTDIESGDPVFDEAVIVKGDLPATVVEFLTPGRRLAIRALFEAYPDAIISDNQIEVRLRGFEQDANRIVGVLNRILSTAASITGADPEQDAAADLRAAGDLEEAIAELRRSRPPDPWTEFGRKQAEAEMLHIEGAKLEAGRLADELVQEAPADPVAARLRRLTAKAPARSPAAPEPEEQPAAAEVEARPAASTGPPAPTLGKTATEAVAELFDPEKYSFDTMDLFDTDYRGMRVIWEGTLSRFRDYERDRELGTGPGTKAVFRLHDVDHGLFQGQGVDAVVGLPPGTELERSERYRFEGVLVACDAVVRNLYIADAQLR